MCGELPAGGYREPIGGPYPAHMPSLGGVATIKNQETRMDDMNDTVSTSRWRRRTVLGALGAAPAAVGAVLAARGTIFGTDLTAPEPSGHDRIPPDTRPGGAYDRYVAELAAQDQFSGVVLLSHRGRTVLSRSYGMADRERGIRNHEGVAVNLSSAIQPFLAVAVNSDPDPQRGFHSREEVHEFYQQWTRQAELVVAAGSGDQGHTSGAGAGLAIAAQIVEAVTGTTYWDYVHEHVFGRSGMTGSAFYTRPQWLTDEHIAHSYMRQADGSRVDAVRNLDKGSLNPQIPGQNPGRSFIGYASGDGFATAPDLVRFAHALSDGTVLDRPYAELFTGAKLPGHGPTSFMAYTMPVKIINGRQWVFGRGGGGGGRGANWDIYPDTGWVGVVLSNYDDIPLQEILQQQTQAITGQPIDPPEGG